MKKRAKRGKANIRSWEKMRTKLKGRFLPPPYLQDNYSKLHNLQEGSLSVKEYRREFEKLLIKCDIRESEDQIIVRYISGLDPRYAHMVELQQYSSFHDVCVLVHHVEQQKKSKSFKKDLPKLPLPKSSPFNKRSFQPPPKPTTTPSNPPPKDPTPQNKPPYGLNANRRCYKCQGLVHIASDCPTRRVITLPKYEATQVEEEEQETDLCLIEGMEEVVEEADEGD